jgi:hypothetical protein
MAALSSRVFLLHHQLTFSVQDGDANACLMHIESAIVCVHKGSPLGGKLSSLENSEATTRGERDPQPPSRK